MAYKKGQDRRQRVLFPDCIDEYVEADAPVRLFDAFVNNLKMDELGFVRSTPAETGTPGYDPRDLLKLYIYGYFYQVRSSRKLARECKCNVEVMWLLNKLTPDFRTISDFRKDNNLTLSKLDDRIKRLDEHISIYMEELEAYDHEEGRRLSKDELQRKLGVCMERKERYEGYRDTLEKSGESQISLTDPDSRLMKANEGFCVGYNVQTAVDAESHMIAGFQVTNSPTDHGQLTSVASEVKADYGVDVLESTADKGYECPEDHADALANGIVPNVIQRDGSCTEQVQFDYNEATITDEQKSSTNPENLKACLEAAVIPEAYKDFLTDVQIVEVKEYTSDVAESAVLKMTPEQMRAKALEGYFVRDAERNLVYCPQGEILRQKSIKRNGMIRYCNKLACKKCKCKCTIQKFKEADFNKDTLTKATEAKRKQLKEENKDKPKPPRMKVVKKVVRYVLHLDQNKMDNRKCLSEHPFGTIKRALGQYYFLLKGKLKVTAEMGLFCLSYNLRRAISLKGVPALIASLG